MEAYLATTNYVGGASTLINGAFVLFIALDPPSSLGSARSLYYAGAICSLLFAGAQLWSAYVFLPDGVLFVVTSARASGDLAFLSFSIAHNVHAIMLTATFAARYFALRRDWLCRLVENAPLFYSILAGGTLSSLLPVFVFLPPTDLLRQIAGAKYGQLVGVDFATDFFFGCTFESPLWGSTALQSLVFAAVVAFEFTSTIVMFLCGYAAYAHVAVHTRSVKLRELNNRLLRARSFQAIFSLIFVFFPGIVINASMMFRFDISQCAPLLCALFPFGTLFNPLVDIVLTTDYRKRLHRYLCTTPPLDMHPVVRVLSLQQ